MLPHDDHGIKHDFSALIRADAVVNREDALEVWAKVGKLYTRASLTYTTDRLVAISGIAIQVQPKIRSKYLAGLWDSSLATDLIWQIEDADDMKTEYFVSSKRDLQHRPAVYIAPTWSWASINTAVNLESQSRLEDPLGTASSSILEVVLHRASSDIYGQLTGGYMRVQGQLTTQRQSRGGVGMVGYDLDLEVSKEIRRSEDWPFTVRIEWDTIVSD